MDRAGCDWCPGAAVTGAGPAGAGSRLTRGAAEKPWPTEGIERRGAWAALAALVIAGAAAAAAERLARGRPYVAG